MVIFVMLQLYKLLYYKEKPAIYEIILEIMFHVVVHVFCKCFRFFLYFNNSRI